MVQVQYVVDFVVRSTADSTSADAHAAVLRHVQEWLEFAHDGVPDLEALPADGERLLTRRDLGDGMASLSGDGPRRLSWHHVGPPTAAARRIDLRVPVRGVPATHVTGVTLAFDRGTDVATVRVVTGREAHGGWIAPTPQSFLRRPAVVRRIVEDPDLVVTAYGRRVDGRRDDITTPAAGAVLVDALRRVDRLPVLLVAPTHRSQLDVVDAAAAELPGLANVIRLSTRGAVDAVSRGIDLEVPLGGARLVWPHLEALIHPRYDDGSLDPQSDLVADVLSTIAPLSVVSRGIDVPFRTAERAGRALAALARQQEVEAAVARGDEHAEVAALRRQLDEARAEIDQWVEEAHRLEDDVSSLTMAFGQVGRRPAPVPVDWHDAPALTPDDAEPLLEFLEQRSRGHLRFTATAARTWRKSGYLHPAQMRSALLTLGQASVEFAEQQGTITARLTDWFRDGFGLDVATTDLALTQSGRASFEFEGARLNGVPHVKLGDAKRWSECGRIYFAYQSDPARFVVHHVGLHDL
ncbi:hypothetical protein FHR75_004375 [Kineococcus radiotolerans]|uniref:Uncharacterized protein n=1 Tax=Kineococcus radiotolerans TaxID=131568 RepID=A0A7W4TR19_KINRA|nr:hypothetical protein [Kineococcus radiotolerans]MBB2903533.1 hypothetical protein [Kineococcus radiotolerans]